MFRRLLEQSEAVAAALSSLNTALTLFNRADQETVSEHLELLAVFNKATVELSSEKRVSASDIFPLVKLIHHKICVMCQAARYSVFLCPPLPFVLCCFLVIAAGMLLTCVGRRYGWLDNYLYHWPITTEEPL